mmetsp:Transcript_39267/g.53241  ORF Transcript_39267/g.53241 Transcript_39267/m.53241 type:complete len:369 (-) Transcript_39267:264-1370(-)
MASFVSLEASTPFAVIIVSSTYTAFCRKVSSRVPALIPTLRRDMSCPARPNSRILPDTVASPRATICANILTASQATATSLDSRAAMSASRYPGDAAMMAAPVGSAAPFSRRMRTSSLSSSFDAASMVEQCSSRYTARTLPPASRVSRKALMMASTCLRSPVNRGGSISTSASSRICMPPSQANTCSIVDFRIFASFIPARIAEMALAPPSAPTSSAALLIACCRMTSMASVALIGTVSVAPVFPTKTPCPSVFFCTTWTIPFRAMDLMPAGLEAMPRIHETDATTTSSHTSSMNISVALTASSVSSTISSRAARRPSRFKQSLVVSSLSSDSGIVARVASPREISPISRSAHCWSTTPGHITRLLTS